MTDEDTQAPEEEVTEATEGPEMMTIRIDDDRYPQVVPLRCNGLRREVPQGKDFEIETSFKGLLDDGDLNYKQIGATEDDDAPAEEAPEVVEDDGDTITAEQIEDTARRCHEANAEYCLNHGDDSQPSWENAPDWQRESAIDGVQFHIDNPDAGPADSHNNWMAEKEAAGWVYGDVKDAEAKTHPCMVPFADLPQVHQEKDVLFQAVVKEALGQ